MDQPFKFRYVNEITGVFVLIAFAVLAATVFLAGRAQGLFEPKLTLITDFATSEGSYGLQKGAEIRILDTYAGNVGELVPNDRGFIEATFVIKGSFHRFIRTDSKAIVKRKFAVAGDAFVEITVGSQDKPLIEPGARIECVKDTEITAQIMAIFEEIKTNAVQSMNKVQMVLDELPGLTVQARQTLRAAEVMMTEDVPALSLRAQDMMLETTVLVQGLQRHWLLRKYVDQAELQRVIEPTDFGPIRLGGAR